MKRCSNSPSAPSLDVGSPYCITNTIMFKQNKFFSVPKISFLLIIKGINIPFQLEEKLKAEQEERERLERERQERERIERERLEAERRQREAEEAARQAEAARIAAAQKQVRY